MIIIDKRFKGAEGYATMEGFFIMENYVGVHLSLGYYIKIEYEELQQILEAVFKEAGVER